MSELNFRNRVKDMANFGEKIPRDGGGCVVLVVSMVVVDDETHHEHPPRRNGREPEASDGFKGRGTG